MNVFFVLHFVTRLKFGASFLMFLAGVTMASASAQAQEFCRAISEIGRNGAGAATSATQTFQADADQCGTAISLSGVSAYHCHWSFAYRAEQATQAFEDKEARLRSCAGSKLRNSDDIGVNHPDSYALKQYEVDGNLISLSLKDKTALDQTLVFLRIEPLTP